MPGYLCLPCRKWGTVGGNAFFAWVFRRKREGKHLWVWLKISQWFWRRLEKVFNKIITILQLSLLWEERDHSFEKKNWIIFTQACFVPSLVENGPVVLEKKKYFKSSQCIVTISQLSPLVEGCGLSFKQIWIPFTQECFVISKFKKGVTSRKKKIESKFPVNMHIYIVCPSQLQNFTKLYCTFSVELRWQTVPAVSFNLAKELHRKWVIYGPLKKIVKIKV